MSSWSIGWGSSFTGAAQNPSQPSTPTLRNSVKRLKLISQNLRQKEQKIVYIALVTVSYGNHQQIINLAARCCNEGQNDQDPESDYLFNECSKPSYGIEAFESCYELQEKLDLNYDPDFTGQFFSTAGAGFGQGEKFMLKNFVAFLKVCREDNPSVPKLILTSYPPFSDDKPIKVLLSKLKQYQLMNQILEHVHDFVPFQPYIIQIRPDAFEMSSSFKGIFEQILPTNSDIRSARRLTCKIVVNAMSRSMNTNEIRDFKENCNKSMRDVRFLFSTAPIQYEHPSGTFSQVVINNSWEPNDGNVVQLPSTFDIQRQLPKDRSVPDVNSRIEATEIQSSDIAHEKEEDAEKTPLSDCKDKSQETQFSEKETFTCKHDTKLDMFCHRCDEYEVILRKRIPLQEESSVWIAQVMAPRVANVTIAKLALVENGVLGAFSPVEVLDKDIIILNCEKLKLECREEAFVGMCQKLDEHICKTFKGQCFDSSYLENMNRDKI